MGQESLGCSSVAECIPSVYKVLGSSPVRIAGERQRQSSSRRQGRGTGQGMRKLWRVHEGLLPRISWEQSKDKQNKRLLTSFEPLKDQPQSFYPSLCQPSHLYKISPQFISS